MREARDAELAGRSHVASATFSSRAGGARALDEPAVWARQALQFKRYHSNKLPRSLLQALLIPPRSPTLRVIAHEVLVPARAAPVDLVLAPGALAETVLLVLVVVDGSEEAAERVHDDDGRVEVDGRLEARELLALLLDGVELQTMKK